MSAALLDVNVLIALFDPEHPNHEDAHVWFGSHGRRAWATCPITINGCVRVLSHPSYPSVTATPTEVVARLRVLCGKPNHEFWPDEISLLDEARFRVAKIGASQHITDVYLLGLAVFRGGSLVTFDRSISWHGIPGAAASNLRILGSS